MRRVVAPIMLCAVMLIQPAFAQDAAAPNALVREKVEPSTGAVIGQHIALYVDVLFPDEMPRPPRVRIPEMAGVQVFRFETQGTTINDSVDGTAYVGQRFEFAFYARRGGAFSIPPAEVTLLDSEGAPLGTVQGKAADVEVEVPRGVDAAHPVVATRQLTLNEGWEPAPDGKFKAGDAIVRTITREAEDVPSLAMLDLDTTAPDGVRVYIAQPDVQDHVERGVVSGKRIDRITYVFARGGDFALPALSQPWWNIEEGTLQTAKTPAVTVAVAAASAAGPSGAMQKATAAWPKLAIGGATILLILVAGTWYVLKHRRPDPSATEKKAFAALHRACTTANAADVYRALAEWRCLLRPDQERAARHLAVRLSVALFSDDRQTWSAADSRSLFEHLRTIRRSRPPARAGSALPPLNPLWS